MKIPISKELSEWLLMLFLPITLVILYVQDKKIEHNIIFPAIFLIPTVILSISLASKKIQFKTIKKCFSKDRLLKVPFSSDKCFLILLISVLFIFTSLLLIFEGEINNKNIEMLLLSLFIFITISIAYEHPEIWFKDTFNLEEELEKIKNNPKEENMAYQDGAFSYFDQGFEISLENKTEVINWDEISVINSYKVDLYAYDSIIIAIQIDKDVIALNDETPGYMKFMDKASENLENFDKEWFMKVAFPAFETNLTVVYQKNESI